jgi:hypothetical protein
MDIILAAIVGYVIGAILTHVSKGPYESQEPGIRVHETPDVAPPRPDPSVKD